MKDADISGADLRRVQGKGIDLSGVTAKKTTFTDAMLDEATIEGGGFVDCDFTEASLENSKFTATEFYSCKLDGMQLHGSTLQNLRFTGCEPGTLKVKDVKVMRSGEAYEGGDLSAVLSGPISGLIWPDEKKYRWRVGHAAIRWSHSG